MQFQVQNSQNLPNLSRNSISNLQVFFLFFGDGFERKGGKTWKMDFLGIILANFVKKGPVSTQTLNK